ncbi:hydantoinase B/oxoprolinase family protein [Nonomuraea angiospora]|uniref:N-methylhydantoinase B n=1 Tax=Nonomuraea angiospora TaxID=46172 RepID=A0ABR9LSC6_9ACTN|nr:hydantoinase B/oxoprolinase family protein [Nonomuraea angiospora]MBE1583566.1 N-methylhydantoinase B [Nonomuraea angiospora]MDX3107383.1 hydantoinase B/oxoprolinase family protein [Nonomuraea angiospora]
MNTTGTTPLDPISVEVIGAALASVVEEMVETMVRAAYSTNIKERRDCTAGFFDAEGRLIAQGEHNPAHLGVLMGVVGKIVERYAVDEIADGDTFVANDPHSGGGTHIPDIVLACPIFADGRLVAWAANLAHHADFGDRGHAHIFQEGLRIPPVRLLRAGELQTDLFDLILLNCQVPDERRSDFQAQLAANRAAVIRYRELCARHTIPTMAAAARALLDHADRQTRAAIREVPDGLYTFEDRFDCPELDEELTLRVAITVRDDELFFDFSGNPPQVRASVNMVYGALESTVYYAVKTLIDPDITPNAGVIRSIHIDAPRGSILNAVAPAAVNARTETCQRVVDLIHGALAPALPDRVTAAHNGSNTGFHFDGLDPRTGKYFVYLETIGGGSGARATKDGLDGVQVHVTNTSNLPVESLEQEYPLTVEAYELVDGSGGVGEFRGGMAIRRVVRVEADGIGFWLDGTRYRSRPWGLFGGGPGASGGWAVSEGARPIDHGHTVLNTGDVVTITTPGAGGYGPPSRRASELVEKDLREGVISAETARDAYGLED